MAGGKETPRQKMIGMMYLVLTALLALNVSKEIINAFVKLDSKLQESNRVFISKSESIMAEFDKSRATELINKVPENQSEVLKWKNVALEIRKISYEMDRFINMDCKNKLLLEIEGEEYVTPLEKEQKFSTRDLMDVQSKDDYDVATRLFGGEPGTDGHTFGALIRTKIHGYRDALLEKTSEYVSGKKYKINAAAIKDSSSLEKELIENAYAEDRDRLRAIYKTLTVPEKVKEFDEEIDWQLAMFDHAPVVAAAALFTSLSNDIRSAEAQALEIVLSRVKTPPFYFNKIEPMSFARTAYLNIGDSMDLNIMIAAYDSNEVNKIKYALDDSTEANFIESNKKINIKATKAGKHTLYGKIAVKEKGIEKWKPWKYSFEVGQPQGVVANEDFTIVYAGYNHSFSASASGFPQENISLSVPGAEVRPTGNGKFEVKAKQTQIGQLLKSSIVVRTDEGTKIVAGPSFMVKKLPPPQVYFGTIPATESEITIANYKANMNVGVRAAYDGSVPLDPSKVPFKVNGFTYTVYVNGNPVPKISNSGKLTTDMLSLTSALRPGMIVVINGISVSGPAGPLKVPGMSFKLR